MWIQTSSVSLMTHAHISVFHTQWPKRDKRKTINTWNLDNETRKGYKLTNNAKISNGTLVIPPVLSVCVFFCWWQFGIFLVIGQDTEHERIFYFSRTPCMRVGLSEKQKKKTNALTDSLVVLTWDPPKFICAPVASYEEGVQFFSQKTLTKTSWKT